MYSIIVENLRKTYSVREGFRRKRFVEALRGISFNVNRGGVHALLGPNGAGKTTLVKILATLLLPDSGKAYVNGFDVIKEADRVRKSIGVIFDVSKGFYTSLSGYENLVFFGLLKGFSLSDARKRAREVLEFIGLYNGAHNRSYHTYSLGMRARLAIAKVLLTEPEIFLLDEPTLGLDVESARMIRKLIVDMAREGRTILITGHNMYEIEQIANSVTIINKGLILADGNPSELKSKLGLLHKITMRIRSSSISKFVEDFANRVGGIKIDLQDLGGDHKLTLYTRLNREEVVQELMNTKKDFDVKIIDFAFEEPTLEDAYIAIIEGGSESA